MYCVFYFNLCNVTVQNTGTRLKVSVKEKKREQLFFKLQSHRVYGIGIYSIVCRYALTQNK